MIRMIKRWNNTYETKLKSFHLEMMVTNTFTSLGNDSREAAEMFFDSAPLLMRTIDPSGNSGDLSEYLTVTNRQLITNRFNRCKNKCAEANRLEVNGDHRGAIEKWREIFGMTSRRTVKNEELVGVCFGVSGGEYCFGQYISILGSCGVLEI
jgi:hypothetical protein